MTDDLMAEKLGLNFTCTRADERIEVHQDWARNEKDPAQNGLSTWPAEPDGQFNFLQSDVSTRHT